MPLYRNWPALVRLADQRLRLFIVLTTDEKLLEKLARGFPELFTDEKPAYDGKWSLWALRRAVEDSRRELEPEKAIEGLGFPVFLFAENPDKIARPCLHLYGEGLDRVLFTHTYRTFPKDLVDGAIDVNGVWYYVGRKVRDEHGWTTFLYPRDLVTDVPHDVGER